MKIAIFDKRDNKTVELDEDTFLKLLKLYYDESNDIEKAFSGVKKELVKKLLKT